MMKYTTRTLLTLLLIGLSHSAFAEVIEIKGEHLTVTFDDSVSSNVAGYNVYIDDKLFNENVLVKSGYKINASQFSDSNKAHSIYVTAQSSFGIESEPTPTVMFKVAAMETVAGLE